MVAVRGMGMEGWRVKAESGKPIAESRKLKAES
jgi:hypothetical protein